MIREDVMSVEILISAETTRRISTIPSKEAIKMLPRTPKATRMNE